MKRFAKYKLVSLFSLKYFFIWIKVIFLLKILFLLTGEVSTVVTFK